MNTKVIPYRDVDDGEEYLPFSRWGSAQFAAGSLNEGRTTWDSWDSASKGMDEEADYNGYSGGPDDWTDYPCVVQNPEGD